MFALSASASAQNETKGTATKLLNGTGKTAVVVVGQTAKYTWKAAKFTTGKVAKPIVVKSAPAFGKFAFRQTGNAVKIAIPVVKKFAITYLKLKF